MIDPGGPMIVQSLVGCLTGDRKLDAVRMDIPQGDICEKFRMNL
jgi:hypothetical protein